jgi:protein SCO1
MPTRTTALLALGLLAACHRVAPAHDAGRAPPCHCRPDAAMAPGAPLPDTSLFLLDAAWTDQGGRSLQLASLRGSPTVVLMFYGSCQSVCPVLIGDVLRIEAALSPAARARVRFALITFDPETDTTARLAALAAERHLDPARWSLLRGSDADVRAVATVLGVQYSRVDATTITHSNTITVLDPQGVVVQQLEGLRQPIDAAVQRLEGFAR